MLKHLLSGVALAALGCASNVESPGSEPSTGGNLSSAGSTTAGAASSAAGEASSGGAAAGGATTAGSAGEVATAGATTMGGMTTGGSTTGGGAGSSASAGTGAGGQSPLVAVTIYLAGDSTVSTYKDTASTQDQAGWGQMLPAYFGALVTVQSRAVGGRTARRFIEEEHLAKILSEIDAGDYLFVQFGTNDSNKTATYMWQGQSVPYYLDPRTDFKTYLQQYIDGARAKGAIPVLVTPPPRNSAYCTGGNGTGSYAQAMRELGTSTNVAVVDLNQKSVDYLKAICPSPAPENFFLLKADGSVDGTHFQENGARILAGFVADGVRAANLGLARHLE